MRAKHYFVAALTFALVITGIAVSPAGADPISFAVSSGSRSASVVFDLSGSLLTVILTNTSSADVLAPTDVLTGVFFDTTHTLTPLAASLNGSTVFYGSIVNNVGEGWQYLSGIDVHGENSGISATGLGVFGPDGNFFSPPVAVDGLAYGILSAGDNSATGNKGVTGHGPLIKDSIQFTLTAASGFSLGEVNSIVFQYGTALDEPFMVPEPAILLLLGSGLVGLGAFARHWNRK